jgi:predicted ribosomally synthesized peptide with SipW-like signal peptide
MKNNKMILASAALAVLAGSVAIGGTYALFTSEAENDVNITSGQVVVSTALTLSAATSGEENTNMLDPSKPTSATFQNGGQVSIDSASGTITVDKMSPMDSFTLKVTPTNRSTIAIKYCMMVSVSGALSEGLKISRNGVSASWGEGVLSDWTSMAAGANFASTDAQVVTVSMPKDAGSEFASKKGKISIYYSAIQANASVGYKRDDAAKTLEIYDESGMAYWNKNSADMLDYTVSIDKNMDLGFMNWDPLGYGDEAHGNNIKNFTGTFNGNGHYINNMKVFKNAVTGDTGKTVYGYGFFASLGEGALVKDVVFNNAVVLDEYRSSATDTFYRLGNAAGIVAGFAKGAATLENVRAWNSAVTGYAKIGSLVGYTLGSTQKVNNCWAYNNVISATCEAGGLYGCVTRKAGAETLSASGNFVSNNTWVKDSNSFYQTFKKEKATFSSDDKSTGTMSVKEVSGTYWVNGDYYYGAYGESYVSIGGSYDAPLVSAPTTYFAFSELVID